MNYTNERVQFGVPLSSKQLVQEKLVDCASEIVKADLMAYHYSRLKEQNGSVTPEQVSLCKRNNVAISLDVARTCRNLPS